MPTKLLIDTLVSRDSYFWFIVTNWWNDVNMDHLHAPDLYCTNLYVPANGVSNTDVLVVLLSDEYNLTCRKVFNTTRTKSQNLNDSRLVLQLSLTNPLKPDVKPRMKMLEQRRQAILHLHLSDPQFNCLLRCGLYQRHDAICIAIQYKMVNTDALWYALDWLNDAS